MSEARSSAPLALVTGASGGIGEAFARVLAADGYGLILVARRESELNRVSGVLASRHQIQATVFATDLTRAGATDELEAELADKGLVPDLLVNNAGFGLIGPATELDRAEQLNILELNVLALTDLSLRFGRTMRERGSGGIINVSSIAGYMPGPNMAVYYASKAYITSFTLALATELSQHGVRVSCVLPGVVPTGFHRRAGMESMSMLRRAPTLTPMQTAELGYAGYKSGRTVIITGRMNRIMSRISRMVPHSILLPFLQRMNTVK